MQKSFPVCAFIEPISNINTEVFYIKSNNLKIKVELTILVIKPWPKILAHTNHFSQISASNKIHENCILSYDTKKIHKLSPLEKL